MTQVQTSSATGKRLSVAARAQYQRAGYFHPLAALSLAETHALRRKLEDYERAAGSPMAGNQRHKAHLLFPWLWELVFHPNIVDAMEDLLGPNLLCWSTTFFIKEAHDPSFVSWHQDATYWGLSTPEVATAWVALSPSTLEAGAMRVIPGTHHTQFQHRDTFEPHNLLTRGQEVAVAVNPADAVDLVLAPGEMSLHHVLLVHGSEPNRSDERRIGFAIRYVPTHVRQVAGARDSAVLVRGIDQYQHFDAEQRPAYDLAPEALAHHHAVTSRQAQTLYRGTGKQAFGA